MFPGELTDKYCGGLWRFAEKRNTRKICADKSPRSRLAKFPTQNWVYARRYMGMLRACSHGMCVHVHITCAYTRTCMHVMNVRMDVRMDVQMDGWTDGRTDGYRYVYTYIKMSIIETTLCLFDSDEAFWSRQNALRGALEARGP